ncbi:MAG: hypothetical protein ABI323_06995 [Solirubrobacteraceae bacterium]
MRVLLSHENFDGFGGTETYVLTMAQEFQRLGHEVAIFSPNRGAMSEHARTIGTPVLAASELPAECDLVVNSDAATASDLAAVYPSSVRAFVVHSTDFALQAPPQLDGIVHAVVVLNDRVGRMVKARAWHAPLHRLHQPITLSRFRDLGPPRTKARVALISSNYVAGVRAEMIEHACRGAGLEVRWLGTSNPSPFPEAAIADADVVIGLGRSVLEGLAAGRAGFVYGTLGADGWITPERYAAMESDGFAGMSRPEVIFDEDALTAELSGWRSDLGELGRDLVSAHHGAREHAVAILSLADEYVGSPAPEPTMLAEIGRLIRLEWARHGEVINSQRYTAQLRAALEERDDRLAALGADVWTLHKQLHAVNVRYEGLKTTRRYRLAAELARPLDRARALLGRGG